MSPASSKVAAWSWLGLVLAACSQPSEDPKTVAATVDAVGDLGRAEATARPLDVLLVVDTAPSACFAQQQLVFSANEWIKRLAVNHKGRKRSIRVATTSDAQFKGDRAKAPQAVGQLVRTPNEFSPLTCVASRPRGCAQGSDCATAKCYSANSNGFHGTCPTIGPCFSGLNPSGSDWICERAVHGALFPSCNAQTSCTPICTDDDYCVGLYKPIFGAWADLAVCDSTYSPWGACRLANMSLGCKLDSPPPPILAAEPFGGLDAFGGLKCLASVGFLTDPELSTSYQTLASSLPGPLAAALAAASHQQCKECLLAEPNCGCPAESFPRKDADLLIVVMSHRDDCSLNAELTTKLNAAPNNQEVQAKLEKLGLLDGLCMLRSQKPIADSPYWAAKCVVAQKQDKLAGGIQRVCPSDCIAFPAGSAAKSDCEASASLVLRAMHPGKPGEPGSQDAVFMATSDFVQAVRDTKSKSARTYFAAIIGDSSATTESGRYIARTAYYLDTLTSQATSKYVETYICSEGFGVARFGARLLAVAKEFGSDGIALSLCSSGGVGGALGDVADWFLKAEAFREP